MKVFISNFHGKVEEMRETDCVDIGSKRYSIRIRANGILIIRHARPKKGIEQKVIFDKKLTILS